MFLRAIATYDYEDDVNPQLTERKSAYERWAGSKLTAFECQYLKEFIDDKDHIILPLNTYFQYEESPGNYYYFKRVHDGESDRLLVMNSKSPLGKKEMAYLFVNINHIDVGHEAITDTLDDIVKNPLGYTGKDLLVNSVRRGVDQTKGVMLDNVDKMLDRGEKLEVLVSQTAELARSSQAFLENSKQLRENQQCCSGLRTTTRHAGEAVTGLFSTRTVPAAEQESELLTPPPRHN